MSRTVFGAFLAALGVCSAAARHCAADLLYLSAPTAHDIFRVSENLGVSVFAQGYATPKQLIFNPHDTKVYVADAAQNFVQARNADRHAVRWIVFLPAHLFVLR
jgi:hypothetical protein